MEEGLPVRKEANMGRIRRRTGVIEISGVGKGIPEVEDGSVASNNTVDGKGKGKGNSKTKQRN